MRLPVITLVVVACLWSAGADLAHLKAAKTKLVGRLLGKHHKRGVYSAVPTFKLGHDIPHVSHSVVKPLVVTYPPTASVAAVKVPVAPPYSRFPVGHKVPHAHFGLKYPHQTKTVLLPNPGQHFHHHHHHVPAKPVVPVLPPAPVVPVPPLIPQSTVVHPLPAPSPTLLVQPSFPEPILPPQPLPLAPSPVPSFPPHFPLKQLVPIAPIQPASAISAPSFPLAPQFNYVIRPGNAVQTSFFATYPRYPLLNYQSPLLPAPAPAAVGPYSGLYNSPHLQHLVPQDGVFEHQPPALAAELPQFIHPTQAQPPLHLHPVQPTAHLHPVQPTPHLLPTTPQAPVHLHPTSSVPLDHDGWSPVAQPHDFPPPQPDAHFADGHHFSQEPATQVYEHHSGSEQQYHDYQNLQHHIQQQLEQAQHEQQHNHIQQQLDQAQYEQHLNNQHQLGEEYGAPQQEYGQPHEYEHGQDLGQHGHGQEYGFEGRSGDGEEQPEQRYHNHIPLGLQPPIDRPLDHFR